MTEPRDGESPVTRPLRWKSPCFDNGSETEDTESPPPSSDETWGYQQDPTSTTPTTGFFDLTSKPETTPDTPLTLSSFLEGNEETFLEDGETLGGLSSHQTLINR